MFRFTHSVIAGFTYYLAPGSPRIWGYVVPGEGEMPPMLNESTTRPTCSTEDRQHTRAGVWHGPRTPSVFPTEVLPSPHEAAPLRGGPCSCKTQHGSCPLDTKVQELFKGSENVWLLELSPWAPKYEKRELQNWTEWMLVFTKSNSHLHSLLKIICTNSSIWKEFVS